MNSSHATRPSGPGLAAHATGPVGVLSQSIANIAPSAVVATGVALIYTSAGSGTWLSYLLATAIMLMVGYCISTFARRSSSAGALYSYAAKGLRPSAGFASGWAIMIGYIGIAVASLVGAALFLGLLLDRAGVPGALGNGWAVTLSIALALGVVWAVIRGIKLSTRVGFALEVMSISAIVVVLVATLFHKGFSFDTSQLSLSGSSFNGVTLGIVLAILGFVGFESAASLGMEARNPRRAIPRAVLWSAAGAGLLYVLGSYIQVKGLGGKGLVGTGSPINDLADAAGLGFLGPVIDFGVSASFFACAVASVTATTRMLFAMGHEGLVSGHLARTHERHQSPHLAVFALAPLLLIVPTLLLIAANASLLDVLIWAGTVGTFGFMVSYMLVSIAAPVMMWRLGERTGFVRTAIIGGLAALAMGYVFFKNVYPAAPAPLNLLPWVFAGLMALGFAYYASVRLRSPERTRAAGSFAEQAEIETAAAVF